MRHYEGIINVMSGMFSGRLSSSTLEQHCSAVRMDDLSSWTSNQINYAIADVKKDIKRLDDEFGR